MLNIIKADLYRIFRGKAIYIILGVLVVLTVLQTIAGMGTIGVSSTTVPEGMEAAEAMEAALAEITTITRANGMAAPFIVAGFTGNLLYFLIPLLICFAGVDFSSATVKNVLSRGVSRTKYYFAKLIPVLFFAVIIQILNLFLPIVVATIRNGFGGNITGDWILDVLKMYGSQTLLLIAFACVGVFIVFLTKKTSAIIALFIAFLVVPTMIFGILVMISIDFEFLMKYDLVTSLNLMSNFSELKSVDVIRVFSLCAFCIIASTTAGLAVFKKSDIK